LFPVTHRRLRNLALACVSDDCVVAQLEAVGSAGDAAAVSAQRPGVAREQLTRLHQAIHAATDALEAAPMHEVARVQGVLVLMDDARRLAVISLPVVAAPIQQAERALAGVGETAPMSPEERKVLARSLLASILRQIDLEVPHPGQNRPH
jgi:hypothetical protein